MRSSIHSRRFSRREFLKSFGLAAGGAALLPMISTVERGLRSPAALQPGRLLRGSADGRILLSLDGGEHWETLASFGAQYEVLGISQRGSLLLAKLRFGENTFYLKSVDGKAWYSHAYQPPRRARLA